MARAGRKAGGERAVFTDAELVQVREMLASSGFTPEHVASAMGLTMRQFSYRLRQSGLRVVVTYSLEQVAVPGEGQTSVRKTQNGSKRGAKASEK